MSNQDTRRKLKEKNTISVTFDLSFSKKKFANETTSIFLSMNSISYIPYKKP